MKPTNLNQAKIWTFFYGSYLNLKVLKEVDILPDQVEVARLNGYDIYINPLANLIRSDQHSVYGILATATHAELSRLYDHAEHILGGVYLPEAVLAETLEGAWIPALCYIAPSLDPAPATNDYIDRIVSPGKELGFPTWYIERLESFRS